MSTQRTETTATAPANGHDTETAFVPGFLSADDYALQQERIEVYTEGALFIDGTTNARRQQTALVKLLDTLAQTPRNDLYDLIITARDHAIKNAPELTEEIAAKLCDREIEQSPAVSEARARADVLPVNKLREARDTAILAAGKINDLISEQGREPNDVTERIDDLARRGQAIIDDTSGKYDEGTRDAIRLALAADHIPDDQLRELIERAESGRKFRAVAANAESDDSEPEPYRPLYVRDETNPALFRLSTDNYICSASADVIEKLAAECLSDGDEDQHIALLELLTHLLPNDGSGWCMYARNVIVANSTELKDTAADLLVANAQHKRGVKNALNSDALDVDRLAWLTYHMKEMARSFSAFPMVAYAQHIRALALAGDIDGINRDLDILIEGLRRDSKEDRDQFIASALASCKEGFADLNADGIEAEWIAAVKGGDDGSNDIS